MARVESRPIKYPTRHQAGEILMKSTRAEAGRLEFELSLLKSQRGDFGISRRRSPKASESSLLAAKANAEAARDYATLVEEVVEGRYAMGEETIGPFRSPLVAGRMLDGREERIESYIPYLPSGGYITDDHRYSHFIDGKNVLKSQEEGSPLAARFHAIKAVLDKIDSMVVQAPK